MSEESRHALHTRLGAVLGPDEAATLMEYLPPVGWADVATKHDLNALAERIDLRFGAVDLRFESVDRRFESVDRRFDEVDRRFESIDRRLGGVEGGLDEVKNRLEVLTASLDARFRSNLVTTLMIMTALLAAFATVIKV